MMKSPEVEAYFIGYSETSLNADGQLAAGRINDEPLSGIGLEQAQAVGESFWKEEIHPGQIYSSPALRARLTTKFALYRMGIRAKPVVDGRLQETDRGLDEDFKDTGGVSEVGARMFGWMEDTFKNPVPEEKQPLKAFIFSDSYAISCLAGYISGRPPKQIYDSVAGDASISLFTKKNNEWGLEYLGRRPD